MPITVELLLTITNINFAQFCSYKMQYEKRQSHFKLYWKIKLATEPCFYKTDNHHPNFDLKHKVIFEVDQITRYSCNFATPPLVLWFGSKANNTRKSPEARRSYTKQREVFPHSSLRLTKRKCNGGFIKLSRFKEPIIFFRVTIM